MKPSYLDLRNIVLFMLLAAIGVVAPNAYAADEAEVAYRGMEIFGNWAQMKGWFGAAPDEAWMTPRTAIWIVAQIHLYFAAFVLAVPIFALIIEYIGYKTGDEKYDKLAYEFTKLLSVSFSLTATFGAILTFMLIVFYPKFTGMLAKVFGPTFFIYAGLFFAEAFFLYTYYYGWGKFSKRTHLLLGLGLNLAGTAIMLIANGWVTFMTSPAGYDEANNVWHLWTWYSETDQKWLKGAMNNFTWMPINIHRVIANVAFGGSIAAAYGAFKFLGAKSDEERAHYDWMGYIGNFVAICAFLPLPFAGYWLGKEIYGFSQNLGMTLMGGAFSWLFIIQAILICNLFVAANLYLWLGMGRIPGAERFRWAIKFILVVIGICFAIWATPASIIITVDEVRKMGASKHPILQYLGVMSAKNTAVNILILSTYFSFYLYRRGNKSPDVEGARTTAVTQWIWIGLSMLFMLWMAKYSINLLTFGYEGAERVPGISKFFSYAGALVFAGHAIAMLGLYFKYLKSKADNYLSWAPIGTAIQSLVISGAVTYVIFIGIYGYFVPTKVRIMMSVPQVLSVLITMLLVTVIDVMTLKNAKTIGKIEWGKMPAISQYALFFSAITFTWLMGLMGYVRSGLRQEWHVFGVMRDKSPEAYTPTLGEAATVVSVTVIIFFLFVAFVFWLASLGGKKEHGNGHVVGKVAGAAA